MKHQSFLFFLICMLLTAGSPHAESRLVILHTNDVHGHPLPFYNYPAPGVGGLPAIATFVSQVRAENKNVLILDAGDFNTGRPESNFFSSVPDIIGYNYIGYDAVTVGNHEFDKSIELFEKQARIASFPFISANIRTKSGQYLTRPYIIKTFEDLTVGIFGITTRETETIGNPDTVKDLIFEDEVTAAKQMVKELRGKVDILIALTHIGIRDNMQSGSRRIAANVKGIDLIIDGHSHTDLAEPIYIEGIPIVQAWKWGMKVGKAVFTVENNSVRKFQWGTVPINLKKRIKHDDGSTTYEPIGQTFEQDPFLLNILRPYAAQVDTLLSQVIGESDEALFNKASRERETRIGNLVADAMLWYTEPSGVDFALQNGGGIRADLPAGPIDKRVIYEVLPFDNSVITLKLSGQQIRELFDYMASIEPGNGAFPQISKNVRVTFNQTSGTASDLSINGSTIIPGRTYMVATNSYLAAGGDGYKVLTQGSDVYDTSRFQRDVIIAYIQAQKGKITSGLSNRIILNSE